MLQHLASARRRVDERTESVVDSAFRKQHILFLLARWHSGTAARARQRDEHEPPTGAQPCSFHARCRASCAADQTPSALPRAIYAEGRFRASQPTACNATPARNTSAPGQAALTESLILAPAGRDGEFAARTQRRCSQLQPSFPPQSAVLLGQDLWLCIPGLHAHATPRARGRLFGGRSRTEPSRRSEEPLIALFSALAARAVVG